MKAEFWHEMWEKNEIGFHEAEFNCLMVEHFNKIPLREGSRIFVPLCGKTLDMRWLLTQGYHVVGAELSTQAVKQFFQELGLEPTISTDQGMTRFQAEQIDIFAGDIFGLTQDIIGSIDAVYDRAALVALPLDMRIKYTKHLKLITQNAPLFILTFEYDCNQLQGPPFAIFEEDLNQYYQPDFTAKLAKRMDYADKLKGFSPVDECAWILTPA